MGIGATLDAARVRRLGVLRGEAAALMRLLAMPAPRLARRFSSIPGANASEAGAPVPRWTLRGVLGRERQTGSTGRSSPARTRRRPRVGPRSATRAPGRRQGIATTTEHLMAEGYPRGL